MARDINGNYTLPAGNPVVSGTAIQAAGWWNPTGNDLATEMTDSLSRSGKGGMLAVLKLVDGNAGAPALSFISDTTMGWYKSAAGTLAAAIGGVLALTLVGSATDTSILTLPISGSGIKFARSADGQPFLYVGAVTGGSSDIVLQNLGGVGAKVDIGGGTITLVANAVTRLSVSATVATPTSLYDPVNSVGGAGLYSLATYESGSFTGTLAGCTSAPTALMYWRRVGPNITLVLPANLIAGSGNTTAPSITGMPAGVAPAAAMGIRSSCMIQNNTVNEAGYLNIPGAGTTITAVRADGSGTFTNGGNKGFAPFAVTYPIQ